MSNFKKIRIGLWLVLVVLVMLTSGMLTPSLQPSRVTAPESTGETIFPIYIMSPAINAPANLTAVTVSPTQIQLRWQDMSNNEIRFKVQRKTGRSEFFTVNIVGSNVTEYLDRALNPGSTYYYRVIANGTMGDSEPSNEAIGSTSGVPPEIPLLLSPGHFFIVSTTTPRLTWSPAGNATAYSVQISNNPNFTTLIVEESGISDYYYDVPDGMLSRYKGYYWRVSASNAAGQNSDWSEARRFVIFPWSLYSHG